MQSFSLTSSLRNSAKTSLLVLKYVIFFYLLSEILIYYRIMDDLVFLFEPVARLLSLPEEAALAIITGVFFNLYGAIALAGPLGLSAHEWNILAILLGICHSLPVESAIMNSFGIRVSYAVGTRVVVGLFAGYLMACLPAEWFGETAQAESVALPTYGSLLELLEIAMIEALWMSLQIILLVTLLTLFLDYIRGSKAINRLFKKSGSAFSLIIGLVLGITYGAGALSNEIRSGMMSRKELFFVSTFILMCHAIIEDTMLFVIFGANFWLVVVLRGAIALGASWLLLRFGGEQLMQHVIKERRAVA